MSADIDHDPVTTAWSIHSALLTWTSNVDTKASFALTIESGLLVAIISLAGNAHRLTHLHGFWTVGTFWAGSVLIAIGALTSGAAVLPWIRGRKVQAESAQNFVFFGHLKDWDSVELAEALRERNLLPVLSRQLQVMSRIAWRKHRQVQASMLAATIGGALVVVAAIVHSRA